LGVLVVLAKLRSRMTYANVVATIALFVALGGSSYAALKVTGRNVPKDALTGADIKNLTGRDVINNSLTGADVKNLTSADVTNGKLLAEDFAPGQLPKGETGATGPAGSALAYAHINADGTVDQAIPRPMPMSIRVTAPQRSRRAQPSPSTSSSTDVARARRVARGYPRA
jgi:hypothetical protein